jgi:hypothetical protein
MAESLAVPGYADSHTDHMSQNRGLLKYQPVKTNISHINNYVVAHSYYVIVLQAFCKEKT